MKVNELIEILKRVDGDLLVIVDGHDLGYDDIHARNIQCLPIERSCSEIGGYCGKYDEWSKAFIPEDQKEKTEAILLSRSTV